MRIRNSRTFCGRLLAAIVADQLASTSLGVSPEKLVIYDSLLELGHAAANDGLVGGLVGMLRLCLPEGILRSRAASQGDRYEGAEGKEKGVEI